MVTADHKDPSERRQTRSCLNLVPEPDRAGRAGNVVTCRCFRSGLCLVLLVCVEILSEPVGFLEASIFVCVCLCFSMCVCVCVPVLCVCVPP